MKRLLLLVFVLLAPAAAFAHVGSKDVFETVHAGPYTFFVTVRPPDVIPGVATVEVRSSGAAVTGLSIVPLPVTGEASKHPPAADVMQRSATDPAFFTGAIWIMAAGTWQVRLTADGAAGVQQASVPVLAVPVTTLHMQRGLGTVLALLALFLIVSMAGVVGAAVRESRLRPGVEPTPALRRRGALALSAGLAVMIGAVVLGGWWWNVEAADYERHVYKALPLQAVLRGKQLELTTAKAKSQSTAEGRNPDGPQGGGKAYLLDHGKVMHLYAIREPGMDAVFHLHPTLSASGDFDVTLPAMPPGHYDLYGDVVHANGFPETLQAQVDIPAGMPGVPLDSEDASAAPAPLNAGELGTAYKLPDGYTMTWDKPGSLTASTAYTFQFRLLDPQGKPATDMQPYLGMAGHAAFVKTDGTVFAHTHPDGSAAMADMMLADASMPGGNAMQAKVQPGNLSPEVDFPYGFPSAGRYRIFVQMKHGSTVETGVFDAEVK